MEEERLLSLVYSWHASPGLAMKKMQKEKCAYGA